MISHNPTLTENSIARSGEFATRLETAKGLLSRIQRKCHAEHLGYKNHKTSDELRQISEQAAQLGQFLGQLSADILSQDQEIPPAIYRHLTQSCRSRSLNLDPVLQLILADHFKCQEGIDQLHGNGLTQAWKNYDAYQRGLGEFFPARLRADLAYNLKRQDYDTCSATALEDLDIYAEVLFDQARTGQLRTGFPRTDAALESLPGLTILGGVPGVGKSCLALQMAWQALRQHPDLAVVVLSLDMAKEGVYHRLLCQIRDVECRELASLEWQDLKNLCREVRQAPSGLDRLRVIDHRWVAEQNRDRQVILDPHTKELLPREIQTRNLLRRVKQELNSFLQQVHARKLLVVVDYLQLLPGSGTAREELEQDLGQLETIRELQTIPDSSFLVVSEVRKANRGHGELTLEDLRGHSRLGYQADAVLLVYDDTETQRAADGSRPLQLKIAKGRAGIERVTIPLVFEYRRQLFREGECVSAKSSDPVAVTVARSGY